MPEKNKKRFRSPGLKMIIMMDFKRLAEQYKTELMENVLPFWLQHSQDKEFGGYFTCLKRNGEVFDTDKFIWLQGREVWMFAMLYNKVEKRQEWLDCAIQGGEFLKTTVMMVTTTGIFARSRRISFGRALQHLLLYVCYNGFRTVESGHW